MTVVFVLFAAVATTTFDIVVTRTLTVLVALESFGAACVTVAWLAAFSRETILIRSALITTKTAQTKWKKWKWMQIYSWDTWEYDDLPSDARFAVTLTSRTFARWIEATDGIAVAALAAIARYNVEISILTFITIATDDIGFTTTSAGGLVTYRHAEFGLLGTLWVAGALLAVAMWHGQRIAEMSWQAGFTVRSGCVVDTFQAFAGGAVAVAYSIRIDVVVTVTRLTQLDFAQEASWIAVIAIGTKFTTRACKRNNRYLFLCSFDTNIERHTEISDGTLQTDDVVVGHL